MTFRHKPFLYGGHQPPAIVLCIVHFQIQARFGRLHGSPDSIAEIGHDETLESPFFFQNISQQIGIMPAPISPETVVGTHNGANSHIYALFKMGEVYFPQSLLIHSNIHQETGVFHAVGTEMFDTGHHMFLHPFYQGRAHNTQKIRVFAIGFLCPSPAGMAKEVNTYAGK